MILERQPRGKHLQDKQTALQEKIAWIALAIISFAIFVFL